MATQKKVAAPKTINATLTFVRQTKGTALYKSAEVAEGQPRSAVEQQYVTKDALRSLGFDVDETSGEDKGNCPDRIAISIAFA